MSAALCQLAEAAEIVRRCEAIVRRELGLGSVRAIDAGTRFADHLKADSLHMVSITMAVEEEFGIAVSDDEAAIIESFGDMVAAVGRLIKEGKNNERDY